MTTPYPQSPDARFYPDLTPADYIAPDATEEKENEWLISFLDIITLLLTFFVLALALNAFPQRQKTHHAAPPAPVSTTPSAPATVKTAIHNDPTPAATPTESAARSLPSITLPLDIKDKVDIVTTLHEVNLTIKDEVLFDEGSTNLKASGASVLARIAQILGQNNYPISVEGHTDNTPIHSAQFPSNWELSTYRATTVTRYFIEHGIAVNRLRAIGYADTRPIAANDSEAGRARNRRVSLVVHVSQSAGSPPPGSKTPDAAPNSG